MSVRVLEDAAAVTAAARAVVVEAGRQALAERGRFTIALAGGSTPRQLYAALVDAPLDWTRVLVFFGDERCVPPEHADSNYHMAREAWLSKVAIPTTNVHRIYAESDDARAAAVEYQRELERVFEPPEGEPPRLDLVLLGLGTDGHTASLFPGSSALEAERELVVATWVEKLGAWRITLTARTINAARSVLFLVVGADKRRALQEVLEGAFDPARLPAQLVRPEDGACLWLVDQAAAAGLAARR